MANDDVTGLPADPAQDPKKAWQSKTVWLGALTSLIPLAWPQAGEWIAHNPDLFSGVIGVLFTGLRFATRGGVVIR